MTGDKVVLVKYIFLDIVGYSRRTVEAQCDIIRTLNRLVKGSVNRYHIADDSLIYIPTGDGMCIALLDRDLAYDIHVTIAKEILRRIHGYDSKVRTNWRKFQVRIGINQSDDNLVIDINGRENVAGSGINNARRIMDLADTSQIFVSSPVYENLFQRKNYLHSFGVEHRKTVKHGLVLKMHQLIEQGATGLNVDKPSSFVDPVQPEPEPRLTKFAAYYFAHSISKREFLLQHRDVGQNNYALTVLIWNLAIDSLGKSESTMTNPYHEQMPETEHNTLDEQFQVIMGLPFWVCNDLRNLISDSKIGKENHDYFEDRYQINIVNAAGRAKLESEWPDIWREFSLDESS